MTTPEKCEADRELDLELDFIVSGMNMLRDDVTPLREELWHYTTADALDSILRTGSLWATNARYVNDPNELWYGHRLIERALRPIERNELTKAELIFHNTASDYLDEMQGHLGHDYFCICLSEKRDDLSQYRAYSSGGKGYCIGLGTKKLVKNLPRHGQYEYIFELVRVEYDPTVQVGLLGKLYDLAMSKLAENSSLDELPKILARSFVDLASAYTHHFKQSAFEAEAEWRIVPLLRETWSRDYYSPFRRCRVVNGLFVPYLDLKISGDDGELAITEILIGPGQDPNRAEFGLRQRMLALPETNRAKIQIVPSSVQTR